MERFAYSVALLIIMAAIFMVIGSDDDIGLR